MLKALFLVSFVLLVHTYIGYPLLMRLRARLAAKPLRAADWEPRVDVVVVAHNAAAPMHAKLANLLALDYPADKLRIHAVSDGSEDATATVALATGDARVIVHAFPQRRGKSACLGEVLSGLDSEIVVFTDVRQRIDAGAIRALLRPFADATVGAVSGELMFEAAPGDVAAGVDLYWRYEKAIRRSEGESGSVVGVTGALWAARRTVLPAIPPGLILDDLWVPLEIARQGARIVFAADALAWDRPSTDAALEAQRKRRTLAGNFQLIAREPALLLPWAHPLGWRLWGHKWLRLLAPWLLFALFASNLAKASTSPAWQLLALAQCAFYLGATVGLLVPAALRFRPVRIAATFVRMNAYAVLGLFDFLRGRAQPMWAVTRHSDTMRP
ncbi:MAG: glycosyltransferase [Proteobacteria bacterium]|nr:glycosyltransferase [Pseudomonadota bacterium]